MDTNSLKTSKHVRFDEVINDIEIPDPNARQLWVALVRPLPEYQEEASIIIPQTLDSQHTPFTTIHDVLSGVICDYDTLGMILGSFPNIYRVYLNYITTRTSCSKIKFWKKKFRWAYIRKIKIPHLLL